MSEMVERVARALFNDEFPYIEFLSIDAVRQDNYRGHARAAIEAMREPLDSMVSTATLECVKEGKIVVTAADVWRAQIDEALR